MTTRATNFPRNCGTATSTATLPPFRKATIDEESFELSVQRQRRLVGTAVPPTQTTVADRVVNRSTSAAFVEDVLAVAIKRRGFFGSITFSSETPEVVEGSATNDGQFQFAHVANGTAQVVAESSLGLRKPAQITVSSGSATDTDSWQSWATTSLGHHIAAAASSRASASGVSIDPWLVNDHIGGVYLRRQNHWLYDIDLSCVSVWNSQSGQLRGGTLVTPEHCVLADHFSISTGATMRFVSITPGNAGKLTFEDRTVVGSVSIPFNVLGGDIQVVRLSAPVSVPFCKVLPTNLMSFLPSLTRTKANNGLAAYLPRLPVVATNQDKHFGYLPCYEVQGNWITLQSSPGPNLGNFEANQPTPVANPALVPFVRSGCSGHPVFFLINGELVLVGLYFGTNAGSSFERAATHDAVNAALTTLGGGYQLTALTESDLAAFASY